MADSVEYNLYTRFHFKNQPGLTQMRATGGAFQGLYKQARLAQTGVQQVGTGMRQMAMFGMGAIAVLGGVVKKGMEFGKAWKDAQAVLRGTPRDINKLREYAKRLGATTLFTARQAAEGMEQLARAGLDARRVGLAIRPVLKLSVADNVELAASAKIVAGAMNQFKDQITDVSQVTDAFAYVSRNSMTNTTELGEAFKYAGPAARLAGQNFYDLMGTLGLLAQANIRGTIAGTAYKNAVVKLAKGGETANKIFGGRRAFLRAVTMRGPGGVVVWRKFTDILKLTMQRLAKIENPAERAGLAFKLFGLRGIATFGAFREAGAQDMLNLITNIKRGSRGTAEEMARLKQQSLHGQWLLFKSALDGVALALYDIIKPSVMRAVKMFSGTLSALAGAFKMMSEGMKESAIAKKYGKTIAAVAVGIKEAFIEVGRTLKRVGKMIFGVFRKIAGGGKDSAKKTTKLITKFILFAAALTPVIAGVGAMALAFSGMFQVISGGFKLLSALTSKWGIAFLALTYVFAGGQKKGESFFGTMIRGLKNMISLANKLLWPFKQLAKYIGTIPALLAGIMTYKVGKGLLARAGSALAMSRSPLARMAGGVVGAATGMPVFVTNWPLAMQVPGVGGAGGAAAAAAAPGLLSRIGSWFWGASAGVTTALGGGKMAAVAAGAKTAGLALGGLALALAPAIAGIRALGKAYDPREQRALRNRLMRQHYAERNRVMKSEIRRGIRDEFGYRKDFRYVYDQKWQQIQRYKRWGGRLTTEDVGMRGYREAYGRGKGWEYSRAKMFPFLQQMVKVAQAGRAAWAQQQIWKTGMLPMLQKQLWGTERGREIMKREGFTQEQIRILRNMQTIAEKQLAGQARGQTVYVQLDGKNIAVATATYRNESRERAGRIPSPGARRRALTRGTE